MPDDLPDPAEIVPDLMRAAYRVGALVGLSAGLAADDVPADLREFVNGTYPPEQGLHDLATLTDLAQRYIRLGTT